VEEIFLVEPENGNTGTRDNHPVNAEVMSRTLERCKDGTQCDEGSYVKRGGWLSCWEAAATRAKTVHLHKQAHG